MKTLTLVAPPPRWWAVCAVCAAIDALALATALFGSFAPRPQVEIVAGVLHLAAVAPFLVWPRAGSSHRWLCAAAVLTLPLVGVGVAASILGTRACGDTAWARSRDEVRKPLLSVGAARRLGDALSACDALDQGDEEACHAALWSLGRRGDLDAIAVMRWAASRRDPHVAQSAALALDEVRERAERGRHAPG